MTYGERQPQRAAALFRMDILQIQSFSANPCKKQSVSCILYSMAAFQAYEMKRTHVDKIMIKLSDKEKKGNRYADWNRI
jgi:hypothetical protein